MADIDVERMDRTAWPWVIGALALLLLIGAMVSLLTGGDAPPEVRPATEASAPAAGG